MKDGGLKKRTQYMLLLLTIVVAILFRYPLSTHIFWRIKVDNYFYMFLANSITYAGSIKWAIHPLSYLGQYPFSSTTGYPLLISCISQTSGLPADISILIITYFISIVGIVGVFLLLKEIFNTPFFSVCGTVSFALIPITFTYSSSWGITDRIFVIYLTPLFLFFMLRWGKTGDRIHLFLMVVTLAFMFLFHKMAYFLLPVVIGYVVSIMLYRMRDLTPSSISKHSRHLWGLLLFISFLLGVLPTTARGTSYEEGFVTIGPTAITKILNAGISLLGGTNLILLAFVPGFVYLMKKQALGKNHLFILLTLVMTLPLLQMRIYVRPFISIFLVIIGIYGLYIFSLRLSRRRMLVLLFSFFMLSIVFSGVILTHWHANPLGNDGWLYSSDEVSDNRFGVIIYTNTISSPTRSFFCNSWYDGRAFQSYINSPALPPLRGMSSMNLLIYGYVTEKEIKADTHPISPTDISLFIKSEGPFTTSGLEDYYLREGGLLNNAPLDSIIAQRKMDCYNSSFIIVQKPLGSTYSTIWTEEGAPSPFFSSLPQKTYKTFESETYAIYYVGVVRAG